MNELIQSRRLVRVTVEISTRGVQEAQALFAALAFEPCARHVASVVVKAGEPHAVTFGIPIAIDTSTGDGVATFLRAFFDSMDRETEKAKR